jgi:hypothetical protein
MGRVGATFFGIGIFPKGVFVEQGVDLTVITYEDEICRK